MTLHMRILTPSVVPSETYQPGKMQNWPKLRERWFCGTLAVPATYWGFVGNKAIRNLLERVYTRIIFLYSLKKTSKASQAQFLNSPAVLGIAGTQTQVARVSTNHAAILRGSPK